MNAGEPKTSLPPSEWLLGFTGAGYDVMSNLIIFSVKDNNDYEFQYKPKRGCYKRKMDHRESMQCSVLICDKNHV